MSFAERKITVTFTLGTGTFGESGQNTENLSGLRMTAKITKAGGNAMSGLELAVYGMKEDSMNKLSTLGMIITQVRRNTVLVQAGDDDSGMSTVFVGTITQAYADLQASPEVAFRVTAQAGLIEAVSILPPSSFTGPTAVSTIMQALAAQMKLTFENNGVTTVLSHPYFWGSPRDQAKACADAAGCEWIIDGGKLAIWPSGASRAQSQVPLISVATGMKDYPAYTSKGISVATLYNPNIIYGGKIEVKSEQQPACGTWIVFQLDYDLACRMPNGGWFTTIGAARPGLGLGAPLS